MWSEPEGGGGDSSMKMPGRLCWGSEIVPILKEQIKGFLCILHTHIMVLYQAKMYHSQRSFTILFF